MNQAPKTESAPTSETLELRVHGAATLPTLVYLPGLHGDWTTVGQFRRAIAGHFRFVEITYPRTLTWSLDDYAAGVEEALARHDIERAWLLGESFSSQVVWQLVARKRMRIDGIVLAGGFVRHPMLWGARLCAWVIGGVPLPLIIWIFFIYAKLARGLRRSSPEVRAEFEEFIARRTELDRRAMQHRLKLIAESDFTPVARNWSLPVYCLTGFLDPIVPWIPVRSWLKRNCLGLKDYKIVVASDHNVLRTAASAKWVLKWLAHE